MAETENLRRRGLAQIIKDVWTGTQTITFSNGETEKDGAAITFDPAFSAAPEVTLSIEKVVETNSPARGPATVEVKAGTTVSSTGMTLTMFTTDPGGATKTTAFTIRYTLRGLAYQT